MVFQKEGDIMHKYMRTIGFSQYTSRQDLDKLLKKLVKDASKSDILKESDGEMFCELRAQTAPGMGVAIAGRLSQRGIFKQEYYFPYVESSQVTSTADCSIQRHTERETFAGPSRRKTEKKRPANAAVSSKPPNGAMKRPSKH